MSYAASAIVFSAGVGAYSANKSAKGAAAAQEAGSEAAIAAQRESDERHYAEQARIRMALSPYVQAGYEAIGYSAPEAAQAAYVPPRQTYTIPARDSGNQGLGSGNVSQLNDMGQPQYDGEINISPEGPRPSVYNTQFNSPAELLAKQEAWDSAKKNPINEAIPSTGLQTGGSAPMLTDAQWRQQLQDEMASGNTVDAEPRNYDSSIERQKPNFNRAIFNEEGTVIGAHPELGGSSATGTGSNLRAFGDDRNYALPNLTSTIQAGDRSRGGLEGVAAAANVGDVQQYVGAGSEGLSSLGEYSNAGQQSLGGLGQYTQAGEQALSGLGGYSQAGQGAIPVLEQYSQAGSPALEMQQAIAGTLGPEAQQAAYDQIGNDPSTQYMMNQAKEGILSGGSATGQLRGGRTSGLLAEMRPAIMSQAINDRYNQLSGLTALGGQYSGNLAQMGAGIDQGQANMGAGLQQYQTGLGAGIDQYKTGLGADASRYLMSEGVGAGKFLTGAGTNAAQNMYTGSQGALTNLGNFGLSAAGMQPAGAPTSPYSSMYQDQGASNAGRAIAQGNALSGAVNSGMSNYFQAKKMGMFDGGGNSNQATPYTMGGDSQQDYQNYSGPDYSGF
jgi:hypothetical protein